MVDISRDQIIVTLLRRVSAFMLIPAFLLVFCLGGFAGNLGFSLTASAAGEYGSGLYMEGESLVVGAAGYTTVHFTDEPYAVFGSNGYDFEGATVDGDKAKVTLAALEAFVPPADAGVISTIAGAVNTVYAYGVASDSLVQLGSITFISGLDSVYSGQSATLLPMMNRTCIRWLTSDGGYLAEEKAYDYLEVVYGSGSTERAYPSVNASDGAYWIDVSHLASQGITGLRIIRPNGEVSTSVPVGITSAQTATDIGFEIAAASLASTPVECTFTGMQGSERVIYRKITLADPAYPEEAMLHQEDNYGTGTTGPAGATFDKSAVNNYFPLSSGNERMIASYELVFERGGTLYQASGQKDFYPDWILFSNTSVAGYYEYVDIRFSGLHSNTAQGVKVYYDAGVHGELELKLFNIQSGYSFPLADDRTVRLNSSDFTNGSRAIRAPCFEADPGMQGSVASWGSVLHPGYDVEPELWFVAECYDPAGYGGYCYSVKFSLDGSLYHFAESGIEGYNGNFFAYFNTYGSPPVYVPPDEEAPDTPTAPDELLYDPLDQVQEGLADVSRASAFTLTQSTDGTSLLTVNLSEEAMLQADSDGYSTFLIDLEGSDLALDGLDVTQLKYRVNIPEVAAGTIRQDSVIRLSSGSFSADIPWNDVRPDHESVEITVEIVDLNMEAALPQGQGLGSGAGSFSLAAYAARKVGAATRSVASNAYSISVSKVNTQTKEKTPVTAYKAKPVIVSVPQTQLKKTSTSTGAATKTTTLVAKKYNEGTKTWESRPTMVKDGKVTFFSSTLSTFAIFETEIEAEDIDEDYESIEVLSFLLEAGVVQGTDEGTVEPYRDVRLNELAAMLVRMDNEPVEKFETEYPGVLEARWFYNEINTALQRGYILEEETYKNPEKWATMDENLRMLFRYKSRHSGGIIPSEQELVDALTYALELGLFEEDMLLDLEGTVAREDVFAALFMLFLDLYGNDEV